MRPLAVGSGPLELVSPPVARTTTTADPNAFATELRSARSSASTPVDDATTGSSSGRAAAVTPGNTTSSPVTTDESAAVAPESAVAAIAGDASAGGAVLAGAASATATTTGTTTTGTATPDHIGVRRERLHAAAPDAAPDAAPGLPSGFPATLLTLAEAIDSPPRAVDPSSAPGLDATSLSSAAATSSLVSALSLEATESRSGGSGSHVSKTEASTLSTAPAAPGGIGAVAATALVAVTDAVASPAAVQLAASSIPVAALAKAPAAVTSAALASASSAGTAVVTKASEPKVGSARSPEQPAQPGGITLTPTSTVGAPVAPTPSATALLPPPAPVTPPLNVQLAPALFNLRGAESGTHVLTLTVAPEAVGPVTVRAHVGADGIRIELSAPTGQGRSALDAMLPELRRDLSQAGMNSSLSLAANPDGSAGGRSAFDSPGGFSSRDGGRDTPIPAVFARDSNPLSASHPTVLRSGAAALDVLA